MTNGDILFNITGDVLIYALVSECYTANDATATQIQYNVTNNTTSTSQTISGFSNGLASSQVGTALVAQFTALTVAPAKTSAAGVGFSPSGSVRIAANSDLKIISNSAPTTGMWRHCIKYELLDESATVTAAF